MSQRHNILTVCSRFLNIASQMSESGLSSGMIKRWMLDLVILITWICSIEMWLPGYCCLSYIEDKCRCYTLAGTEYRDDNILFEVFLFEHFSCGFGSEILFNSHTFYTWSVTLCSLEWREKLLCMWRIHLKNERDHSKVRD